MPVVVLLLWMKMKMQNHSLFQLVQLMFE